MRWRLGVKEQVGEDRRKRSRGLMLSAGKRPQLRARGKVDWSKARQRTFLETLAETCNVTLACDEAGIASSSVYRRKRVDAGFRQAWREAIAVAYQRLELILLERAFVGTEKVITRKDGSEERMVEYSNQLALTLLRMHRDDAKGFEAAEEMAPVDVEELRERLLGKLRRMKARAERDAAAGNAQ